MTTSPDEPASYAMPGREQRRPPPGEQGEGCPVGSGRACDAVFELGAKLQIPKKDFDSFLRSFGYSVASNHTEPETYGVCAPPAGIGPDGVDKPA